MATAIGDTSLEAHCEDRSLQGFVNLGDKVSVGSQSADRGPMESAMEVVTAERARSKVKRRN